MSQPVIHCRPAIEISEALRLGYSWTPWEDPVPVFWGKGHEAKGHKGSQESFKLAVGTGEAQSGEQSAGMFWPCSCLTSVLTVAKNT